MAKRTAHSLRHPVKERTLLRVWPIGKSIPTFTSEEEEAEWWLTTDFEDDDTGWEEVEYTPREGDACPLPGSRTSARTGSPPRTLRWPPGKLSVTRTRSASRSPRRRA